MKKLLAILGLAALACIAIVVFKKSGKKTALIDGSSEEERQLLYGEMPGGEIVDFTARAKARRA